MATWKVINGIRYLFNDLIYGGDGNDRLIGGSGQDYLKGGGGKS